MTKAIDTHAHLWPDEYLELLEKLGSEATQIAKDMHASWSEEDLKKRFTMMEESGVSSQVLSATPQIPQYGNAQQALSAARFINDAYKDLIKAYPDRFRAYGVVPLPHVKEAIQEGRRLINDLKFLGIALNTVMADGLSVTDPSFCPSLKR
ncbi:amidohydrolase [Streptococcus didelphis]|nr:amidohydrolase family protein [Streptococcus didelphis]WMB29453.1 amidohydrolase [Streptococcus didelphis]